VNVLHDSLSNDPVEIVADNKDFNTLVKWQMQLYYFNENENSAAMFARSAESAHQCCCEFSKWPFGYIKRGGGSLDIRFVL